MTANEFDDILTNNILLFWMDNMVDTQHGGFYGRIDGNGMLYPNANKGVVLNARILWTFSAAYRTLGDPQYRTIATRAFQYMDTYFVDKVHGGVYWEVDFQGKPTNRKKQLYAQGFALYGFSEYYRATGDPKALQLSKIFFDLIESSVDKRYGGYFEAFTETWQPITDMRLSTKDANEKKSMNTHLHILESYTNLYRIWRNPDVAEAQFKLINLFKTRILNPNTSHLDLFFDEKWTVKSTLISYGHDIEASWLLAEAAWELGNRQLIDEITTVAFRIAEAASKGLQPDGSLAYEETGNRLDRDRHWWVQAEAVLGFMHAYQRSGETIFFDRAAQVWAYIQSHLIDHTSGEWYWSRKGNGTINREQDKAGPWKCPYHNGRLCLEMITILAPHQEDQR